MANTSKLELTKNFGFCTKARRRICCLIYFRVCQSDGINYSQEVDEDCDNFGLY